MDIKDLETYEQLQLEATIRGMSVIEFIVENKDYKVDNKYFIFGKRIFAFDSNGKFLDCDYVVNVDFNCNRCVENFILIDTSILIPERYYLDIRISSNLETIIHHDVLLFY